MKQKFWFCRMFDGSLRLTETETEMRNMPRTFYAEEPQVVELDVKDMTPAIVVPELPKNLVIVKSGPKAGMPKPELPPGPDGPAAA